MRLPADQFIAGLRARGLGPAAELSASLIERLGDVPLPADTLGFEIRLDGQSAVDVGMALSREGAIATLRDRAAVRRFAVAAARDDRWRRIGDFLLAWVAPGSPFAVRVPFIFLEFDEDGLPDSLPVPSLFAGLDSPIIEMEPEARREGRLGNWAEVPGLGEARQLLALLRREPLDPAVDEMLARCFAFLPDGGVMLHLAAMLGRPGEGVRASAALPRLHAANYLASLGWREGVDRLECELSRFEGWTDFAPRHALVQIDLDVGALIGPTIGVTLRPADEAGWPALLDALVDMHLCEMQKRDALLAWPGDSAATADGTSFASIVSSRYLSHAKITCAADRAGVAKAYFGATLGAPTR